MLNLNKQLLEGANRMNTVLEEIRSEYNNIAKANNETAEEIKKIKVQLDEILKELKEWKKIKN